jgi:tRNA (cmo5U34)-methyltransferase
MTEKDRLFQQTARAEDFVFDDRIAKVFDNMFPEACLFNHA